MAIAGVGNGSLAWLITQSSGLKAQLTTLSAQSVDGKRGTYYGDIAGEAHRAISLRGGIARGEAHAQAIERALGGTAVAQDSLKRLSSIAEDFLTQAGKVTRADSSRVAALADSARQAIGEVVSLLNAKSGNSYLFGGADTAHPPIPDPANIMATTMATDIAGAVATLAPGSGATVLSATLAAATSNVAGATPFSDYLVDPAQGLTEPRASVLADDGQPIQTGLFANRNAAASGAGSETGSWSRDLLRGLMTLASLAPGQTAAGDDFDAVMASVTAGMKSAMTGLGEEAGALGLSESRLEAAKTRHEELGVALHGQLADVEEVDLAATLSAMQETQTRLQASWKALSMLSGLSLADFMR
ncbi:hypothetical protein EAH89_19480 [Roseomonas nepalensis]|uniref:Flagellin C-terminal domain-containing protein n=1 Tax=Muricoccus nepalensis TaxID=1854500 RepID=A0A502FR56_9PROT|nr:flagellin [Roseomonas nepalensis]TPG51935.1 hypothetical protein EAH89_19480 [Roseomonas nepalensis]